jgi:hypothetical protein
MLWSQRSYEVVSSFTCSKPGPHSVKRIGPYMSGTTHPTLLSIGAVGNKYAFKIFLLPLSWCIGLARAPRLLF